MTARSPARTKRPALALLGAAGVLAAATGCTNADEPAVRTVAASFADGDPQARCDLLAPNTLTALQQEQQAPCAQAVDQLPLGRGQVVSVAVWGEDALVRLTDDTLFLTRTDRGWRVSAGACRPNEDGPYTCQLEGP
jgi:hypothetical protein